jgi:DNA-binding transcriptional LysR family regulator
MKIRQIEIFRSVMMGGSTIAAATALGLSQSAVSRQLTQLDEELGFSLFERSKGRLLPRPEAFALMDKVRKLTSLVAR